MINSSQKKNRRVLIILFVIGVYYVLEIPAHTKCVLDKYVVTGTVLDQVNKKPLAEAEILVFVDDYEEILPQAWPRSYPDSFQSDKNGRFQGFFYFDTYSGPGFFGSDRCKRKPKRLTLVVSRRNFFSKRVEVKLKKITPIEDAGHFLLVIQPIEMTPANGEGSPNKGMSNK